MSRKAPRQGVDLNGGVYHTPDDFLSVVKAEFNIVFDLASTDENCVVPDHFTVEDNALIQPWNAVGWNWLNPPYDNIAPWAKKCYEEMQRGAATLFLVPASVGSNWFRDWVYGKAEVRFLNGRLTFKGHPTCYPKDLMLAIYEQGRPVKHCPWNWRSTL
jgi:site-specific DNA-methyltransferase (adenine-specific)